jgi:thymidylate synthase (FAD)
MSVKLVSVTPDAEQTMAYVARVSNPNNQENPNYAKLLGYCIKHNHWSVFEQSFMTLEIETTRGLAAQILRHRSFTYQEELRRQDTKNRQNSIDDIDAFVKQEFEIKMRKHFDEAMVLYQSMLDMGIAKECARFVLPLATPTRLYMSGSCRSWIHYIQLREKNGTQKEHMEIAEACKKIFAEQFPTVAEALEWV